MSRANRGGAWNPTAWYARSAYRSRLTPNRRYDLGARAARSVATE